MKDKKGPVSQFIKENFKHFNSAVVAEASEAWISHLENGGKMFLAMAGAMSTGELGISLAEMIRQGKIHGICTTGANLEEDLFNLVAHNHYARVPHYRNLTDRDEVDLRNRGMNRVTDTCIPEEEAMLRLGAHFVDLWKKAEKVGKSYFPFEYVYQLLDSGVLKKHYEIDPRNSWVIAAYEKKIPIYTPGWEDSTIANKYAAAVTMGEVSSTHVVKNGLDQMVHLIQWYRENAKGASIGFFQIGGGIAGDFSICVVPLIRQDMLEKCPYWGYYCQISDSTTSYGSYSGAVPNEKITWGKLEPVTPRFVIESDASIVAPLVFNYVLGN